MDSETSDSTDSLSHFLRSCKGRVFGRILRVAGKPPERLAAEVDRRLAMVMGPSGLGRLPADGLSALLTIGYTRQYVSENIEQGVSFHLLAFAGGPRPRLATWSNVMECAGQVYPELSRHFAASAPSLPFLTVSEVEKTCGFALAPVHANGAADERFITLDRLLAVDPAGAAVPVLVRRFLYHCCRLSELFSGDGYTRIEGGSRPVETDNRPYEGIKEYVMPNSLILDLQPLFRQELRV